MNLWLSGERMGEGIIREFGMDMYALLYLKWITNKDILYSTGSSAQCYVAALGEGGYMFMHGRVPLLFTWNHHNVVNWLFSSVQFSPVSQSCLTLFDPMDCSTPGLPVHHQLPEFTQTHVHWVGDAIQPSYPLSSPSPPAFSLFQHQGLFQWLSSSHQVPKVLEFQLQHQSFQWIFRTDFLWDGLVGSPCHPRDSQKSSPTPQFKNINSLALRFLYSPTLTSIHDYCKNHNLE